MAIDPFSNSQILEFIQPNSYAQVRTNGLADPSRRSGAVKTSSINESLGLLQNVMKRFDTLASNLDSMAKLAAQGTNSRIGENERMEYYGQIRSLAAGIGQIVDNVQLDGQTILDGRRLNLASQGVTRKLQLENFQATGEDSLNLAHREKGAWANISYDYLSQLKNKSSDLIGLDISEANYKAPEFEGDELTDGNYRLKITYEGDNSSVEVQSYSGTTMKKIEGVDLSGEGKEIVDLGVGVEVAFEKTYFRTALGGDKYDHELLGPTSLYAVLNYQRNETFQIVDEEAEYSKESSVELMRGGQYSDATGSLDIGVLRGGVGEENTELASGQYRMRTFYNGAKSSVWLYDLNNRLIATERDVDLSDGQKQTLDFGNGLKVQLANEGYSSDRRTLNSYIQYTRKDEPYAVFDFEGFQEKAETALARVEAQKSSLQETMDQMVEQYQLANQAQKSNASAATIMAQGVTSLISGAVDSSFPGMSAPTQAELDLQATQDSIFGATSNSLVSASNFSVESAGINLADYK